jgi:hypothetical protein
VKLAGSSRAGASAGWSGVGDGCPRIAISAASAAVKPSTAFADVAAPSLADAGIALVTWAEAASMAPVDGLLGSGACCAEAFGRSKQPARQPATPQSTF